MVLHEEWTLTFSLSASVLYPAPMWYNEIIACRIGLAIKNCLITAFPSLPQLQKLSEIGGDNSQGGIPVTVDC